MILKFLVLSLPNQPESKCFLVWNLGFRRPGHWGMAAALGEERMKLEGQGGALVQAFNALARVPKGCWPLMEILEQNAIWSLPSSPPAPSSLL